MEAFSDGVFAIAITLLVLELAVPSGSEDDLLRAVLDQWPSYLAYLVSFATIGAVWLEHTVITEYLDRATPVLIRLNLLLLLVVAFLPFPTRLLGEYVGEDEPARVAVTIYGLNLFLASAMVSLLWRYAVREKLIRPDLADADVKMLTKRLTPGLAGLRRDDRTRPVPAGAGCARLPGHRGVHHRSLRCAPAPGRRCLTERRAGPPYTYPLATICFGWVSRQWFPNGSRNPASMP
jgi:uncharacterized membrane protein